MAGLAADTHLPVPKKNKLLCPAVMALEERLTASTPQGV
jgi:hypothetical protein